MIIEQDQVIEFMHELKDLKNIQNYGITSHKPIDPHENLHHYLLSIMVSTSFLMGENFST